MSTAGHRLSGNPAGRQVGSHGRGLLLVFAGGVLYASAGVFTRALPYEVWTLLAWRSLAGGLFTLLIYAGETGSLHWRDYRMGAAHWLMVPFGALATICYIVALTVTSVADVMIVYATTPLVTAGIAFVWNREAPSRRLMIASTVALGGVAVMLTGGGVAGGHRWLGAGLVLVMNICFAALLVLARKHPHRSVTPVNGLALLLAAAISFVVAPAQAVPLPALGLMLLFGIVTVGLAMALFMAGARQVPSAEAALIGISDVVLGPLMVFLLFGENPGLSAMIGGAIVVAALVWNIAPDLRRALRNHRRSPDI